VGSIPDDVGVVSTAAVTWAMRKHKALVEEEPTARQLLGQFNLIADKINDATEEMAPLP